ncbi:MAG TPA: hypothetical protein VMZ31_15755 [Phycisphaerae bacterium]|nr:hypothetical protein [Phycisphaerae bacterium]
MTGMGEQPSHPDYQAVLHTLAAVDRRRRRVHLLAGVLATVALTVGVALAVCWVAASTSLQPSLRASLLGLVAATAIVSTGWWIVRPALSRHTTEQSARWIEQRLGGLENRLINAVQLAREHAADRAPMLRAAVHEASQATRAVDPTRVVPIRRLKRWAGVSAAVSAAAILYASMAWGHLATGLASMIHPGRFVPHTGGVEILSVEPGDVTLLAGESLEVKVTSQRPAGMQPPQARLFVMRPDTPDRSWPMQPLATDAVQFAHRFQTVVDSFGYRVEVGDSQSRIYHVTVRDANAVINIDHLYRYPTYTRLPSKQASSADGPIEAPEGTVVEIGLTLAYPLESARVMFADQPDATMQRREAGHRFVGQVAPIENGEYAIALFGHNGKLAKRLPSLTGQLSNGERTQGFWPIRMVPDRPPTLTVVEPGRDVAAVVGERVRLRVRADDDYGVSRIEIHGDDARLGRRMLTRQEPTDAPTSAELATDIVVDPARYRPGDVITYRAIAWDNQSLPDGRSPQPSADADRPAQRYKIIVVDQAEAQQRKLDTWERLRQRLEKLLKLQVSVRGDTVLAKKMIGHDALPTHVKQVADGQRQVHHGLAELVETFAFQPDMEPIRQTLRSLSVDYAQRAVAAATSLAQYQQEQQFLRAADTLIAMQDRIIEAIASLLGALLPSPEQTAASDLAEPGGDMPTSQPAALARLTEALEQFIQQQHMVIDATTSLAKMPVEDFSQPELALLEQVRTIEEQWEKFLGDLISDFSKLPKQDFANSSLVAELVEIQSDVKMAVNALDNKSIEIAVALEQVGLELAEDLTTQIEKWLPDEPDRIKWSMEEPLEDIDVPMAELPDELEDIVGELLEQEEDLFDDIEDVTSGWADSLDKGAGWAAMDGPISNFSAKGVTGNLLPNASEIGGRSGEGRTGRAVGEMVEQTATGKGGRRTPTRLSPDPFQAGEIQDTSGEAPGGATGGGKLSGVGGEGLEGPVPPEIKRELGRLASRQASLRNRAEKIDIQLQGAKLDSFARLDGLIRLMRLTEDDLRNYRYRNALRRRRVLVGEMETLYGSLAGPQRFRRDASSGPARRNWTDIYDVREDDFPPAYRDALRRYYETLSRTPAP